VDWDNLKAEKEEDEDPLELELRQKPISTRDAYDFFKAT
jgi:hypothetical protein